MTMEVNKESDSWGLDVCHQKKKKTTIKKQPQKTKQLWMYVHTYTDKHKNTGFKVFAEVNCFFQKKKKLSPPL